MKKLLPAFFVMAGFLANAQDSLNMSKLGHLSYPFILNDVWGYSDANGNEYALVGTTNGFSVVDVTTPSSPVEKFFIPGAGSVWRDIKTYSHYAYVVHDGYNGFSDGIMIVDLDSLTTPKVIRRYPQINLDTITHNFRRAHNIYIDENGVLYVFGAGGTMGGIGSGGALMFDLIADPENPAFLGVFDEFYLHDGMVRGDTLWGGAVLDGLLLVIDVSSKTNPVILGSKTTPSSFTHNAWVSDDNKTVFTTDEVTDAFVTAYDVSDPANIVELDRIQTSLNDSVIPHNTHVMGDFLVTSYYTSGIQIVDATVPTSLIETAYYDTSPFSGDGFQGNWGAYPYLPSGNILATDREQGLFILSSTYPRGAYLSGLVKDSATQNPIFDADIEILTTPKNLKSDIFGEYKTAILNGGTYDVVVSKAGYWPDTVNVLLTNGVKTIQNVTLLPLSFSVEDGKELGEIQLAPNPSKDFFVLTIPGITIGEAQLKILDITGKVVMEEKIQISADTKIRHQLKSGSYILKLTPENLTVDYSVKLIVE